MSCFAPRVCTAVFLRVSADLRGALSVQDHPVFKRRHNDLFMTKKISLYESLCGFKFVLTHLDGRQLLIQVRSFFKRVVCC